MSSKSREIEALLKSRTGNEKAEVQLWSPLQDIRKRCENQLIPGTGYASDYIRNWIVSSKSREIETIEIQNRKSNS